jgi:hypothetical protein
VCTTRVLGRTQDTTKSRIPSKQKEENIKDDYITCRRNVRTEVIESL